MTASSLPPAPASEACDPRRLLDWRLIQAARLGRLDEAESLLASGALVDCLFESEEAMQLPKPRPPQPYATLIGATPLMAACGSGFSEALAVAELLIARGADPNARGKGGERALHRAAERNDVEAMRLLVLAGADIGAASDCGDDALSMAAYAYRPCPEAVAFLLGGGATVERLSAQAEAEFKSIHDSNFPDGQSDWSMAPSVLAMILSAKEKSALSSDVPAPASRLARPKGL